MSDCTVYIDEAGDLGINRGTKWFVLTAVIADKNTEPDIRAKMAQIRSKLHINGIHMRKIADFNKRACSQRTGQRRIYIYECSGRYHETGHSKSRKF